LDHHYRLCPGSVLVSLSHDLWEVVEVEMETLRVFRGHGRDLWEVVEEEETETLRVFRGLGVEVVQTGFRHVPFRGLGVEVVQTGVESSHGRCL
jgi:hypothetical protein